MAKAEKKYKVTTPNKKFSGVVEGVQFVEGVAEVEGARALELAANFGFECIEFDGKGPIMEVAGKPENKADVD